MNVARKKPGTGKTRARKPAPQQSPPPSAPVVCRRCGSLVPVGDDGFCEKCEKVLEQACL